MEGTPKARLLHWVDALVVVRQGPGELVVAGVLLPGERPVNNDDPVRVDRDGPIWRVVQVATRFQPPSGPMTVTLHLAEPSSMLP